MAVKTVTDEEVVTTQEETTEETSKVKKETSMSPALKEFARGVAFGQYGTGETLEKAIKDHGFKKSEVSNAVAKLTAK